MANERLGAAYDCLICCGPLDLVTRAAAAGGDGGHGGENWGRHKALQPPVVDPDSLILV